MPDKKDRRPGVYRVLGGPPNNWTVEEIDYNLRRLATSVGLILSSGRDPQSIMHYSFEAWMFKDQEQSPCFVPEPMELSAMDIAGAEKAYPADAVSVESLTAEREQVSDLITSLYDQSLSPQLLP